MSHSPSPSRPAFLTTEHPLIALTFALVIISITMAVLLGQRVDWGSFAWLSVAATSVVFLAAVCRQVMGLERVALWLMALGLSTGFIGFASLFAMTLFPLGAPVIDPFLSGLTANLGLQGMSVAPVWFAPISDRLQSLIPLAGLVAITILSVTRRQADLHRMLLAGALALCATLGIWTVAPSLGASANDPSSALYAMAVNGIEVIRPVSPRSLFAFPSLDVIVLLGSAWYARKTIAGGALGFLAGLSVVVLVYSQPTYLVDLTGGALVFAVVAWMAGRAINPAAKGPAFQRRARHALG